MIGNIRKIGAELLFNAINHHNIPDVQALLEDNEADINCCNINGQTPLHYAVEAQSKEMIEMLLSYGSNPDIQENDEVGANNPMHMAVERNMIDIMDLFLQCGGDPTIQNQHGFTCLHISVREG